MKPKITDISVVVPVYGCQDSLIELCSRINACLTKIVSEFEIIFDGHISIQDSIFLKQVERIVTSEDIKMQYLDPNEVDEDFIDEFMLFPFFLKHNGISLVKDE